MTAAVNIFHIFIIVPVLLWTYSNRGKLPQNFCKIGLWFVAFAAGYHALMLARITTTTQWKSWIYWLHILVVFPILGWILWKCNAAGRKWHEMLLLLAFAALGYHVHNLIKYR